MMTLRKNTMVHFAPQQVVLTFLNYDATPTILEKHYIHEDRFSELYQHLADGGIIWDFDCKQVYIVDDPQEIITELWDCFDALADEDNISEIVMQGIMNKVILQNMKKLQEV